MIGARRRAADRASACANSARPPSQALYRSVAAAYENHGRLSCRNHMVGHRYVRGRRATLGASRVPHPNDAPQQGRCCWSRRGPSLRHARKLDQHRTRRQARHRRRRTTPRRRRRDGEHERHARGWRPRASALLVVTRQGPFAARRVLGRRMRSKLPFPSCGRHEMIVL